MAFNVEGERDVATCIISLSAIFIRRTAKPDTIVCKDVLFKHEAFIMHGEALELERECHVVRVQGGIKEAMQGQVVFQSDAAIDA